MKRLEQQVFNISFRPVVTSTETFLIAMKIKSMQKSTLKLSWQLFDVI